MVTLVHKFFANKEQFVKAYPMTTKRDAGKALWTFIHEYGVPTYLTFDGAPEQVGENTLFMEQIRKNGLPHISTRMSIPEFCGSSDKIIKKKMV